MHRDCVLDHQPNPNVTAACRPPGARKTLWHKLRTRPETRPMVTDWTTGWSLRDLADLPPHHPRRDDR